MIEYDSLIRFSFCSFTYAKKCRFSDFRYKLRRDDCFLCIHFSSCFCPTAILYLSFWKHIRLSVYKSNSMLAWTCTHKIEWWRERTNRRREKISCSLAGFSAFASRSLSNSHSLVTLSTRRVINATCYDLCSSDAWHKASRFECQCAIRLSFVEGQKNCLFACDWWILCFLISFHYQVSRSKKK